MTLPKDTPANAQPLQEPERDQHERRRGAQLWAATLRFRPVLVITVVLFALLTVTQKGFLTNTNMENLALGASVLFVVSMGMTFVVLSGGFDLSVGATAALSAYLMAKLLGAGVPTGVAMGIGVVFGAALGGLTNGVLVGKVGLSFFVVTLATMSTFAGIVNLWSATITIPITNPTIVGLTVGHFLGLPTALWIMAGLFVFFLYIQHRTYFGRDVFGVGGSRSAARLSGIKTERTLIAVYAIAGLAAAMGGILEASQIGGASPTVDDTLPLQAAAAVLLGGTSIAGGAGGVGGTVAGVLFIGVLQNGLSVAGVASYWQEILTGIILVLAVLGNVARFGRGATVPQRLTNLMDRRGGPAATEKQS